MTNNQPSKLKTKYIRAEFIGKDSLGYIKGQTYILSLEVKPFMGKDHLWITSPYPCPYSSEETFNENWEEQP